MRAALGPAGRRTDWLERRDRFTDPDIETRAMPEPLAVLKGTLDMLVLNALTWQPMHGFALTRWLEARSGRRLALEDAALYQALYRMEKRGLVEAEWGVSEQNRRARYYRITAAGESELARQKAWWLRYADTVTALVSEMPGAAES